ncbi:MAG TPA: MBL fold metallo-hydrolase [Gemmataceae bacterium]|nr:MBL fold metallo-hydrolase [Gemmataceae bacterium]
MRLKSRLTKLAILGIVVSVFAGVVLWRPRAGFTPRTSQVESTLLPASVAVAPGVYLLGKNSPAAVYLVETSQGLVLIDSGLEAKANLVRKQISDLNFDVNQLRAIFLTHVHADHSLGAEYLRSLTGATVYAGRGDEDPLRSGEPREAFFSIYSMPDHPTHPTTVDVKLTGDETIEFGETRIKVLATPGHTTGSICYLLERPGLSALFTGDVVQHLAMVRGGDLGTYSAYLPPLYRGDARASLTSLRRLRDLPQPDLILPGHPRMDPTPQNPHMPPEQWKELLNKGIADMKLLLSRYEADGADFLDGVPKELLPGLHYLGDCNHTPVYCLATSKNLILFDAPGGPGLLDFLAQRLSAIGYKDRKPTAVLLTSCADEATAGLAPLARQSGCQVVGTPESLEKARRSCPIGTHLVSLEEFDKSGLFPGRMIALGGFDGSAVAYQLNWQGKTILVSGRIPVKLIQATVDRLGPQLTGVGGNIEKYLNSLDRLAKVKPDLWLTAVPVHGQNANLYDDEWENVLKQNQEFTRRLRDSRPNRAGAPGRLKQ